jgi:hypothetical protein
MIAACKEGANLHLVYYAERPHWDGVQVTLRKIPVAYLVLPIASLKMNRMCEDNAVSCPLNEPEMEWLGGSATTSEQQANLHDV